MRLDPTSPVTFWHLLEPSGGNSFGIVVQTATYKRLVPWLGSAKTPLIPVSGTLDDVEGVYTPTVFVTLFGMPGVHQAVGLAGSRSGTTQGTTTAVGTGLDLLVGLDLHLYPHPFEDRQMRLDP